jgi:hypothetical protein
MFGTVKKGKDSSDVFIDSEAIQKLKTFNYEMFVQSFTRDKSFQSSLINQIRLLQQQLQIEAVANELSIKKDHLDF